MHSTFRHRRPGFLLPEAIVTIFIVGVLLAILVPAVHRARLTSRRVTCLNNAKQLSLALHMYHDVHSAFPPGYVSRSEASEASSIREQGPGWAWGTLILPYIEQKAMAASLDFNLDAAGSTTRLAAFICREDEPPVFAVSSPRLGSVSLPPSSFVGVFGYGSLTDSPGKPAGPGVFYRNSNVRVEDVFDGLSQTLLFGERRQQRTEPNDPPRDSSWLAAIPGAFRDGGLRRGVQEGPASLVLGSVGQDAPEPFIATPNSSPGISTFSSPHDDGAHFARVDGSVDFVSRSIDPIVFRQLAERANALLPVR
jgi:type II secretory pathway pseudopilin PulG